MKRTALLAFLLFLPAVADVQLQIECPMGSNAQGELPVAFVRYKSWFSLSALVQNDGPPIDAVLEIYRVDRNEAPVDDLVYRQAIDLPQGARKREQLYVFDQGSRLSVSRDAYMARLLSDGEVLVQQLIRREVLVDHFLILEVSRTGTYSGLRFPISDLTIPDSFVPYKVRKVDLQGEQLPDRAEGFEAVDLVIVHDIDLSKVSPYSLEALAEWVARGGQLLITGRPDLDRLADTPLGAVLPASTLGITDLDLRPLRQLDGGLEPPESEEGQQLKLDSGWSFPEDAQPLICTRLWGRGQVTQLAFVPSVIKGQTSNELFRALIHGRRTGLLDDPFSRRADSVDGEAQLERALLHSMADVPELNPPNVGILLLLLVVYVLAASLGNYVLLRALKRRELSILTTPLIAISFGLLFYGIGYFYKGITSFKIEYAILRAGVDGKGVLDSHVGLFSASKTTRDLDSADRFLFAPFVNTRTGLSAGARRQSCTIDFSRGAGLSRVDFDQWSFRFFSGKQTFDMPLIETDLSAGLGPDGRNTVLRGTIRNLSSGTLQKGWLLLGDEIYPVPSIPAGQTMRVDGGGLGIPGSELTGDWMLDNGRLSEKLFQFDLRRNYSNLLDGKTAGAGWALVHALWGQMPQQSEARLLPGLYIAELDGRLPYGETGFDAFNERRTQNLLMLDVQAKPDIVRLQGAALRMFRLDSQAAHSFSSHGEIELADGPLYLEFDTRNRGSQVGRLNLRVECNDEENLTIEIYNWTRGKYDMLTALRANTAVFVLGNRNDYVCANAGRVRFRLNNSKPMSDPLVLSRMRLECLP